MLVPMGQVGYIVAFVAAWIILQYWLLPRLGVPT